MSTHALKVEESHNQLRLDVFLTQALKEIPSRSFIKKLIEAGHVQVNDKIAKAHHKLKTSDRVNVDIPSQWLSPIHLQAENIALDIFYEDDFIVVVNKPTGMIVHPGNGAHSGTLVNALLYHGSQLSEGSEEGRPGIVHRLDKETSGLMVIAKDNHSHLFLAKQFQDHLVKKRYLALVEGEIEFEEGLIEAPIGRHPTNREKQSVQFTDAAKEAVTKYRAVKRHQGITLVELYPKTGRMHQLRVHLSYIRHPILGDEKYGKKTNFPRLALHARGLGFFHPSSKKFIEFTTPTPHEFLQAVQ